MCFSPPLIWNFCWRLEQRKEFSFSLRNAELEEAFRPLPIRTKSKLQLSFVGREEEQFSFLYNRSPNYVFSFFTTRPRSQSFWKYGIRTREEDIKVVLWKPNLSNAVSSCKSKTFSFAFFSQPRRSIEKLFSCINFRSNCLFQIQILESNPLTYYYYIKSKVAYLISHHFLSSRSATFIICIDNIPDRTTKPWFKNSTRQRQTGEFCGVKGRQSSHIDKGIGTEITAEFLLTISAISFFVVAIVAEKLLVATTTGTATGIIG